MLNDALLQTGQQQDSKASAVLLPRLTVAPLAVYSAPPATPTAQPVVRRRGVDLNTDLKFVRTIFPSARTGPAIIAVSTDAWSLGVRPGMPLAEARSMAQPVSSRRKNIPASGRRSQQTEVEFHEWSPAEDRKQLLETAELIRRFAPIIGMDEMPVPDSLLLDITGCAPLFGGESALAQRLLRDLQQVGWRCRIGIADTVAAAWAFTHSDGHGLLYERKPRKQNRLPDAAVENSPVLIIPPGQEQEYLGILPLEAARIPPDDAGVLHQLGIRNLRQLLNLPREDLPARLSVDANVRIQQLTGVTQETITAVPETHPVMAEWRSEFPAENRHELQQVFEHLVGQICAELQRRKVGCVRLTCQLSGMTKATLVVEVVKPSQSEELLLEISNLRLEAMPLSESIARVVIQATTAPLPVSRQRDLFSDTRHIVPQEELATLVNRLHGRLGTQAVRVLQRQADPRPEFCYRQSHLQNSVDTGNLPQSLDDQLHQLVTPHQTSNDNTSRPGLHRPVRLLVSPFLLPQSTSGSLLREGFVWQGRRYQITTVVGPERLQTSWWSNAPVQRDYYRILTDTGSLFWIFRDLVSGNWYLHGIFD